MKRKAVFIFILGTHLSKGVVVFFPPTEDRRWCDIRSIQVKDIGHEGILCDSKSTQFLSALQLSVGLRKSGNSFKKYMALFLLTAIMTGDRGNLLNVFSLENNMNVFCSYEVRNISSWTYFY